MSAPLTSVSSFQPYNSVYPPTMYQQPGQDPSRNYTGLNTASPGIAAPFPQQTLAIQQYMPLSQRHQMSPEDQIATQQGLMKWYPKILPGYSTPLPQMLADPTKKGLLVGGITGLVAAIIAAITFSRPQTGPRIGIGLFIGAIAGALTGIGSFFNTRQRNDNILDMMARLPAGATRRDMLSDPVVQADRAQAAMAAGGGGGGDLLTGVLLANMVGNSGGGFRSFSRGGGGGRSR